jgi:hypothetical protein
MSTTFAENPRLVANPVHKMVQKQITMSVIYCDDK